MRVPRPRPRAWPAGLVGADRLAAVVHRAPQGDARRIARLAHVAAGAQALKLLQSVAGRKAEVFTLKLRPGDAFEIRHYRREKK